MSEPAQMEQLIDALPRLKGLGYAVAFDLGKDGKWLLDARQGEPTLTPVEETAGADSTITISFDNLIKLLDGKLDPMVAYGLGRIKVQGSKGVAMKLVSSLA
jgi:putative sterol carrier protein